jgi:hypothetical protein
MTAATSPTGEPHPGTIEYIDHVENRTWTRSAAEVPSTIAWVKVNEQWRPVVRIEINGAASQREITKFGAHGEFLETTTAQIGPPPAAPSEPTPTLTPTQSRSK